MTTTTDQPLPDGGALTTDHSRASADGAHSHGAVVPEQSRAARPTSFVLEDFDLPTVRDEQWRFAPVDRIANLFGSDLPGTGLSISGILAPEVRVEIVGRDDARLGVVGAPDDRASAAAWTSFAQAVVVTIPRDAVASRDTHLVFTGVREGNRVVEFGEPSTSPVVAGPIAGHVVIVAEPMSQGVVVLDYQGDAELTENVEIVVGDGAHLTIVSVQDWDRPAKHLSAHRASIGRDATLKHMVVTLGGDVVRINPEAAFTAPGGDVEMLGLYYADAGQHQEHRLFIDHAVPNCRSRVTYKGALQGEGAHTVWFGDVLIRAVAEGTDTYELNRNLVLTDGARADSVPNLEIETGEIEGAGHASATGRFDDEQLFYLRSRGIPEPAARRLVVRGFFAELINRIGVTDVRERLMTAIEAELDRSVL